MELSKDPLFKRWTSRSAQLNSNGKNEKESEKETLYVCICVCAHTHTERASEAKMTRGNDLCFVRIPSH